MSFDKRKLEQSGQKNIDGIKGNNARKKTNNKWFETQDSISYWDDFNKPKLIWKVIGNKVAFALDKKKYLLNNACYMLTGEHIEYLTVMLNSPEITWYSFITNMNKTGMGEVQIGKQNINLLPIPQDVEIIEKLKEKLDMYLSGKINIKYFETSSESIIAKVYGLNEKERSFLVAFKASL